MPARDYFRLHGRRRVELWVTVRRPGTPWVRDARVTDLGLGGAGLEIQADLEPGTALSLEVRAPTLWDPLALTGAVAWFRAGTPASRAGIAFEHHDADRLFSLLEFLAGQGYDT